MPEDLVLTPPTTKQNRHITVALNHMHKRFDALTKQIDKLTKERDEVAAAIAAVEK